MAAVAAVRPACKVAGWDPMSANRFTIACWRRRSAAALGDAKLRKTRVTDRFAEDISQRLRLKNDRAGVGLVVICKRS